MPAQREITHAYAPTVNWTCISHPDDEYKTLVNEKGALLYEFTKWVSGTDKFFFKTVFSFGLHTSKPSIQITQTTESARHPFVKTTIEYEHATLELIAFAHKEENNRTDIVLWKIHSEKVTDTAFWVDGQSHNQVYVLPNFEEASHDIYVRDAYDWFTFDTQSIENATNTAFRSIPYALELAPAHNYFGKPRFRTPVLTVKPDAPVQGALIFPLNHQNIIDYDLNWAHNALKQQRHFWDELAIMPSNWHVPDHDLESMIVACARNILQAREIQDGIPEFQVGSTCYRGLWVVDGHFILEAARYLGHEKASEHGIDALLRRVREDGSIAQMPSHLKETGISLATIIRQCELNNDWEKVASLWSIIANAVQYIQSLREASQEGGEYSAEYNLMPPAFGDGGLGGIRAEYTTTLWSLIGLKQAMRAASHLEFVADLNDFQGVFNNLLSVFRKKAERDLRVLSDGTPYLPMAMPDASSMHRDDPHFEGEISPYMHLKPGTATWALAHAIYPGEIFVEDDPIVTNLCTLLDKLDDEQGIPVETGWLTHNGLWTYAASFYAHVWLYAGRADKAIDYLYAFANHATTTRVWREEQSLRSASFEQIIGDMPHNWASAEFIRLVRHLLIFEKKDELHILPALPSEWIKENATIRLSGTPTRYGLIDLEMVFDQHCNATLELRFNIIYQLRPRNIILFLPPNLEKIFIDNKEIDIPDNRQVTLSDLPKLSVHMVFSSTDDS